jgi:DNA-directed RNA polymerase specialized sigma24 family protein
VNALSFREWLNNLVLAVVASWEEFDADGVFTIERRVRIMTTTRYRDSRMDPYDLLGSVWLAVTSGLPTYDPSREFGAWFNRIVNRVVNGEARRGANAANRTSPGVVDLNELPDREEGPVEKAEQLEKADRFSRVMARLREKSPPVAEIVRLRTADELTFLEILHRYRNNPRMADAFRGFFPRTTWDPGDKVGSLEDKVRRLHDEGLKTLQRYILDDQCQALSTATADELEGEQS